jgi:hypothetical protein
MIKHIVMYKLENPSEENKQAMVNKFLSMKGKIDVLLDIESGIDKLKSPRSYDVVLICTFKSLDDLNTYKNHEVHIPVMQYVHSVVKESHSVDFEF